MATGKLILAGRDRDQSEEMKKALDSFMRSFYDATEENPIGKGRVFQRAVLLEAMPHSYHIWLKTVWAIEKRRGWGKRGMQFICDLADACKVPVTLTPQKFGKEGMTNGLLKQWYRKFGFVPREGGDMVREPKGGQG